MQVLTIESELGQRCKIRCALDLTGKPYELREISSLHEVESSADFSLLRLVLIGMRDLNQAVDSIALLRGRMTIGNIIAYGEFNAMDNNTPSRIRAAGADVVLDSRFSASKMAMMIDRFTLDAQITEVSHEGLSPSALRQAIRAIAPSAL